MLDKETANIFAKVLKIDLFTVFREYFQLLFLKFFYQNKETSGIYFKGGTAIRFILGSFRFSEDLDFSSTINAGKIESLIVKTLKDLNSEGEVAEFKKNKTLGDSFSGRIFKELDGYNFPLTIKLDFSLRETPFETDSNYIETTFPVSPYPIVNHLASKEMLAEKVRALLVRGQGRDIFDIWYLFSKKIILDKELVDKKMKFYNRGFDYNKLINSIKQFPDGELRNDLSKFLPLNQRYMIDKIKASLLEKL
jgi:predicted nucleotidyltransferase component of viral defense system